MLLAACGGKSGAERLTEAQASLNTGKFDAAVTAADQGLAAADAKGDAALAWRLEQVRLEGLAQGGKGNQVKADLERLAGSYPQQVTPALYRALADKVSQAGDTNGAIDLLTAGDQRFPDAHASFVEAIEALKAGGNLDPAQVQRLKALGYL
jgi:hypothetical protein